MTATLIPSLPSVTLNANIQDFKFSVRGGMRLRKFTIPTAPTFNVNETHISSSGRFPAVILFGPPSATQPGTPPAFARKGRAFIYVNFALLSVDFEDVILPDNIAEIHVLCQFSDPIPVSGLTANLEVEV